MVRAKDVRDPAVLIAGLKRLVETLGNAVMDVGDRLEDEGDRVYLGSTNHVEQLKMARTWFFEWRLLDSLPGVAECRHGNVANGSCEACHRESEADDELDGEEG